MSGAPRVSGRKVVPVVLGLIALAVAAGMGVWFLNRFPNGTIEALTPVDDARVLVLRHGYEARRYLHLTMEGEGGARHWSATLFGVQPGAVPVPTATLATVQAREARGNVSTHAYRLDDGSFAFRAGQLGPKLAYESEGLAIVRGEVLYTLAYGEGVELFAVRADGSTVFHLELPRGTARPRLEAVGDHLYVDSGDGRLRVVDARAGEVIDEGEASFCATDGEVIALEDAMPVRVEGRTRSPLASGALELRPPLWACGRLGEERVLFVGDPADGAVRALALAPGAPAPRYDVRVGEGAGPRVDVERPTGALPAHVWLPDGPRGVVAFDLRAGREVGHWEIEGSEPWSLRRLAGRTLLRMGDHLVVLADNGSIGASATVTGLGGVAQLPQGGRLWAWSGTAFVALDPESLAVEAGGAGVVEVRASPAPLRPR